MKFALLAFLFVFASTVVSPQSGRRLKVVRPEAPAPEPSPSAEKSSPTKTDEAPPVTAEKNEEYRCSDDGSLAHILSSDTNKEQTFTTKEVDTRATISNRPTPGYTREARRNGVQGYVILKVVLSADGTVGRIRVVRRLPFGLTENAIRAACKIQFRPAMKEGIPVSQLTQIEYTFRLAESSILGP